VSAPGRVCAVVVAAGSGTRMGAPVNKVLLDLAGEPVLRRAVRPFLASPDVDGVWVVCRPGEEEALRAALGADAARVALVPGGATRQESVLAGLRALPEDAEFVLVHDGARPLVTDRIVADCLAALRQEGSAVACTRVVDTIKRISGGSVLTTIPREALRAVQTPQGFRRRALQDALEDAQRAGVLVTDEAGAMERLGLPVHLVECADGNRKITTAEDLLLAEAVLRGRAGKAAASSPAAPAPVPGPRVGVGFDVHRLVPGRRLVLCGVEIPYALGLEGHSDADVAVHALMDAILGAACLGDIGRLYPDTDDRYLGADSMELLRDVVRRAAGAGLRVAHADVTIVAQAPKLQGRMAEMAERLRAALPGAAVNVKATTTERLGFTGRGEGIAAQAAATLVPAGAAQC
jgi:2-C-methyl-D-erythritol 4-phosphate cytidylyltransferase/2-C-methyl-D-erythritol 2,4-cyclodiphosphate synthase